MSWEVQCVMRYPYCCRDKSSFIYHIERCRWRNCCIELKLGVVRSVFIQNVAVGNVNNGILVTDALLNRKITIADFRALFYLNSIEWAASK